MNPRPPIRPPRFIDDGDGPPTLASAQWLVSVLCGFARMAPVWQDRAGREIAVQVAHETDQDAVITLAGAISGRITLSVDPSLWVRADVSRDDGWIGRGWIERPFEECAIWPDGADGIIGPGVEDDPPGRVSKRGAWIQFDTAQWPGFVSADRVIGFRIPED
jgi:hypothetical protein